MPSFVRFIFLLLLVGVVMNLAIVMVSNARTRQRQIHDLGEERQRFGEMVKVVSKQLRRGEIAVEWQRIDANQKVIETSLLVRQFMPREDGSSVALPTTRVIIPGDRVCIDGMKLDFDMLFSDEYAELRGATLFEFQHVYAEATPVEKRFTFMPHYGVPPGTEIHNMDVDPLPTYFENKLWQYLWFLIESPHPEKRGLTVTKLTPASRVVKDGALYQITVGLEGVTISDDESMNSPDRDAMLLEGANLK